MKSKFPLKEKTIKIRNMDVTIRELTHGERIQFANLDEAEKVKAVNHLVSMACVRPTFSVDDVANESGEVVRDLADAILELSALTVKEGTDIKQSYAG